VTPPPLSLYVHLPWCARKCPYCDFNSREAAAIPDEAYVDTLLEDLRAEYAGERRPLRSVFIGGGTPSLFSGGAIERLLGGIRDNATLDDDAEITMEANPGSAETAKLAAFARAGVNRFSIGVQSFSDHALARLGRIHDAAAAAAAIDAARTSGARSFNVDLMHGLPGQDREAGVADVRAVLAQRPPHVSWYQLTIERNTVFYRQPPTLPDEATLASLEERGAALLATAGYRRYEISAWAQPGQECRHNLNYWQFGDYLAIGAGAHGKITDRDGRIIRYAKTRRPEDYLGPGGTARRSRRELDARDRVGEFMLGALRLRNGFDRDLFEARTGLDSRDLAAQLEGLHAEGLLLVEGDNVRASERGWRFLDDLVGRFF
jgi:putative oxygen-independent coproporphyrinogen III oxidase